ncbi:AP2/ERF and B3 domain-containing transcription factor [Thalictrum thalictroides]|uniref:AP2/ERF and B3 domain-containing transcription factor n=1 Tax=Thalictrum thalictroides TaxID=46969 RepID=A0A7J6V7Z5_THATH|nr:AP2/ERF and B3 domain-containing transcription factor [Thalictrum thalictroides]
MEEEKTVSMVSNTMMTSEASSESNGESSKVYQSSKRQKLDSLSASYKGVVFQNGHWGAQIYANQKRIWLGTFSTEKEAAMAYDSAAIKLGRGDYHRNFPLTTLTIQEAKFQDLYQTETVLSMIRDKIYNSEFMEFVKNQSQKMEDNVGLENPDNADDSMDAGGFVCHQLFHKELTASDVGKLNRLVIPKKHAVKYFPQLSEESKDEGGIADLQLVFFDRQMRSWKFRYCYWKTSQSYVFTKGWNGFVKEKDLKAKDVVKFYNCEQRDMSKTRLPQAFCMIDVEQNNNIVDVGHNNVELQLGFGSPDDRSTKQNIAIGLAQSVVEEKKISFKLFGEQIIIG